MGKAPGDVCGEGAGGEGAKSFLIGAEVPHIVFVAQLRYEELHISSTVCKLGALQKARLRKLHFSGDFLGVLIFS